MLDKNPNSSKTKRIKRIRPIFKTKMYEKHADDEYTKLRIEKEMNLATALLAEAGIEEPKLFKIKTGILLKTYLIICTVLNLVTMMIISGGRLKAFYFAKSVFTSFGLYSLHDSKCFRSNLIFTALFGASILMESIPCVAGILLLFSRDVCSVLSGISDASASSSMGENEEFLKFCRRNVEVVRVIGSAVIVSEILLDSLVFLHLVQYQRYLKQVQIEKKSLNYYNGKERIALP